MKILLDSYNTPNYYESYQYEINYGAPHVSC